MLIFNYFYIQSGPYPPFEFQSVTTTVVPSLHSSSSKQEFEFDGFLWGVPKSRRSVETRLKRKFGHFKLAPNSKMLKLRHDLTTCTTCGSWHEIKYVCAVCYKRVKEETKLVQKRIVEALKLDPVEQEVEIKYENEQRKHPERVLVEIEKPRPAWFGQNLLARSGADMVQESQPTIADQPLEVKVK